MGKFQDVIDRRGYRIQPIKTVKIPTAEEYLAAARERDVMKAQEQVAPKVAGNVLTGGMLGVEPGARLASMFPEYQGLADKTRAGKTRLEDMRKAHDDLYELEGEYGLLANDAMPEEDRARYQARYDEIMAQYGKGTTSKSLWEQMGQLQAELDAAQDQMTDQRNWARIGTLSQQELDTLYRYSTARKTPFEVVGGHVRLPAAIIQTDPEVRALFEKYGKENVDKLAETVGRDVNATAAEYMRQEGQKVGEKLGFGAIPVGVTAGLFGTPANLIGIAHEAITGTGQYRTSDPYHAGGMLSTLSQGIGAGGAKKAPEQMVDLLELMGNANPYSTEAANFNATPGNYTPQLYEATRGTKAGEVIDAVGSGAYQTVNTAVDSIARAYLGGSIFGAGSTGAKVFSLGLAGARSFGDTYNDVSAKGGTPGQAAVRGVFNAGTEIVTEYIPLEQWWKVAESGSDGTVAMLKAALKQGGMEATQEEIGFLATSMMEFAVLREKSEFQVLKRELMDMGYSSAAAERMMWEEFGKQAAGVALTSFFSGTLSEAGAEAYRSLMPGTMAATPAQEGSDPLASDPSQGEPRADGATTPPSPSLTAPLTQGSLDGRDVSEVGTVPRTETPLTKAQDYYRQNGTVSNSMAEAILADNAALTELKKLTPVQLGGTKSQDRAAVKAAVARISGEAELSGEGTVQAMADAMTDIEQRQSSQAMPTQERDGDMDGAIGAAVRGEAYAAAESPLSQPAQMTDPQEGEPMPSQVAPQSAPITQEQQTGQTNMDHGAVGAAEAGFTGKDTYYDLIDKYGEKPARAGDDQSGRLIQVPDRDTQGRRVTDFASNAMGAQVTSDEMANTIEDLVEADALGFDKQTNQEAVQRASEEIAKSGWARTHKQVRDRAIAGGSKDGDIAKAMLLYAHYNKKGDIDNASEMMIVLSMMANRAGRDLQIFAMFRRLTPEGKLMTLQKTIDRAVETVNKGRGKRGQQQDIEIPPQLKQLYLELAGVAANEKTATADAVAEQIGDDQEAVTEAAEKAVADATVAPERELTEVEKMGQRVAERIRSMASSQGKPQGETLFAEIMRIVNENIPKGGTVGTAQAATPNLEALAEYYSSMLFFPEVWQDARERVAEAIRELPDGSEKRAVLEEIYDRSSEVLTLKSAADPGSVVRRAAGEAAKAAGYRMDNRQTRKIPAEAKREMADVLTANKNDRAKAARMIAQKAVDLMGLDGEAADKLAADVTGAFYADLADRAAATVQRMLTPKAVTDTVKKSIAQRLGELYNMGAFENADVRQALMDTVFGEGSGVDVPNELLEKYVTAAENKLWDAEEAIYTYAGSQMRGTFADKWRAWRYMAMLGNVRTQVRNLLGNAAFVPYKAAKDMIGAAAERIFLKQEDRTKAVLNLAKENDRQLLGWAKADAKSRPVHRAMEFSGQMGEDVSRGIILENQRIFASKGLEAVRRFVAKVPGAADMLFKNGYYANSLAGFLKARGYTAEQVRNGQVSEAVMAEARTYAITEAMRATFNDCNAFSDWVSSWGRNGKKGILPAVGNAIGEAVMPFRRTPANILVRFVEYSPMGILTTAGKAIQQARNGEFSASAMIDGLSANLTGTAVMALGALPASGALGIRLHGGVDDEDDKRRGIKSYSIEFDWEGRTYTYTIDWLVPVNLPLFLGANLYEAFTEEAEETNGFTAFTKFLYGCGTALEPMLELSCLSGIADLAEGMRSVREGEAIAATAARIATSYFTQGIPALLRQAYQASQETEMETFANSEDPLIRGAEKTLGNIPFVGAVRQTEKLDEWGEEVSRGGLGKRLFDAFINPGKLKEVDTSAVEEEIARLNAAQPDKVAPPEVPKTFTYTDENGVRHEDHRLTEEEYQTWGRTMGQTARELLDEVVGSDAYAALNDRQKAAVFASVYEYARETARDEAIGGYVPDYSDWMKDLRENGIGALFARTAKQEIGGAFGDILDAASPEKLDEAMTEMGSALAIYDDMSAQEKARLREDIGGRGEDLLLARDAGVSTEDFFRMYDRYTKIDGMDVGAADKDGKWSIYLQKEREQGRITRQQEQVLRENMQFFDIFPGDAVKVDQLRSSGLSGDEIFTITHGIDLLRPLSGNSEVSEFQKYEKIAGSGLGDEDTDAAMLAYMPDYKPTAKAPDRTELKYRDIRDMGFSPQEFIEIWKVYRETPGGDGKKRRTINAIDQLPGIDSSEAAMLYAIISGDQYKEKK